jgi:hypothetical protein
MAARQPRRGATVGPGIHSLSASELRSSRYTATTQ